MTENELARIVYNKGLQLHQELGPGLLEKVYEECLYWDLKESGLHVKRQRQIPIRYKNQILETKLRADLVVNNKLLIELKSVDQLNDIHMAQTITYLKLSDIKLGLLINFNVSLFKKGVRRVINGDL